MPRKPTPAATRRCTAKLHLERLEDRISPALLGQSLFPDNSPFNQVIANAPVAGNSAAIMQYLQTQFPTGEHGTPLVEASVDPNVSDPTFNPLNGIPYNVVHGNSPGVQTLTVQLGQAPYLSESDVPAGSTSITVPYTGVLRMEVGSDHHLLVYDLDNQVDYEFYGAESPDLNGTTSWTARYVGVWDVKLNTYKTIGFTSADAAGLPILPLLIRPDEALPVTLGGQGAINHALRFTLPSGFVQDNTYLYPASHMTVGGLPGALPYIGMRLRLNPNLKFPGLTGSAAVLVKALQTYGLILADRGGDSITGVDDSVDEQNNKVLTWENSDGTPGTTDLAFALGQVIPMSAFQVVNLAPVINSVSPGTVFVGDTVTVRGQNFSGAAGHLSVLFGGSLVTAVPSPNVTVVNDTTLLVQVPPLPVSIYSTAYVWVRSGIAESSANTTYDAVGHSLSNATRVGSLWGYGTSTSWGTVLYAQAATSVVNAPATVVDPSGVVHLFEAQAGGGIGEWDQTGAAWKQLSVVAAQGKLPPVASELTATIDTNGSAPALHLVYRDKHGQLDDVWRPLTDSAWHVVNLSAFLPAGAVALGSPSVFTAEGIRHVVTRALYPSAPGATIGQQGLVDLATDATGATTAADLLAPVAPVGAGPPRPLSIASDPVAYAFSYTSAGQAYTELHYVYRDDFGSVESVWRDGAGTWHTQSLAALQGLNNTAVGTPSAFVSGGSQLIVYRNQDGQVQALTASTTPAATWQPLALPAGLPTAASNPQGADVNGQPHLLYVAQNGSLVEVAGDSWTYLTATTGTAKVRPADSPRALVPTGQAETIFFNDSISHRLMQATNASGAWTVTAVNAPPPTRSSAPPPPTVKSAPAVDIATLASLYLGRKADPIEQLIWGWVLMGRGS